MKQIEITETIHFDDNDIMKCQITEQYSGNKNEIFQYFTMNILFTNGVRIQWYLDSTKNIFDLCNFLDTIMKNEKCSIGNNERESLGSSWSLSYEQNKCELSIDYYVSDDSFHVDIEIPSKYMIPILEKIKQKHQKYQIMDYN